MADQWYCMVVGQEVGPITSDDLMEMLEKGQIDPDDTIRAGSTGDWQPVRELLDLSNVAVASPDAPSELATSTPSYQPAPTWYYRTLGSEFGPSTFDEIRDLAAEEQIAPDDEVREGTYGPWKPAATIPGLFSESAVRQRAIEVEQAREERERKKRDRRQSRQARKAKPAPSSDDLLGGMDELDDVPVAAAATGLAALAGKSLPTDPAARAAMLKQLDAEYQQLRSRLAAPSANAAPPSPPPTASPAASAAPAVTNPYPGSATAGHAPPAAFSPPERIAAEHNAPPAMPSAPSGGSAASQPSRPTAPSLMQDMAAAQIRASQTASRPTPRAPYAPSSRSSGGGGFDFSNLNISGKTIGIAAAVIGVLVVGYFGMTAGLIDFSSGAVYDETVVLYGEFKKVTESAPDSPEFTAFHQKFKPKQQELLAKLGQPSRGSTADEVRRAVLALATVVEAYRRPEITPAEREPYLEALDTQMTKLKQSFGR